MSLPRERFWDIQVPKIDSPTRQPLLPRPPCVRCFAPRPVCSRSKTPPANGLTLRSDAIFVSPARASTLRENSIASQLPGTNRLRFALPGGQRTIVCAPDELRDTLRKLSRMQLVRMLAAWRPDLSDFRNVSSAYRISLKSLGRRYLELHDEIADLDAMIGAIVEELAPLLIQRNSIGRASAAQLLLTAGDNPDRIRSEARFAALCGVSPVPASSGKVTRHRLNRGGDRAANSALHIIAIGRLRTDPRTKAYVDRKIAEGHSKLEAIRCLKRYLAREVYNLIRQQHREIVQTRIAT